MIVADGKYYLYRHIRKDTNQVFYVGAATKEKAGRYTRAYNKRKRNRFWNAVVAITDYEVEIMLESNSRKFILEKEKEFISLYGRKDLGAGGLVNLTDGGMEGLNKSADAITRQLNTAKANGTYQQMVDRMRNFAPKKGEQSDLKAVPVYLYDISGRYIKKFRSRGDCANYVKTFGAQVTRMINLKTNHKNYLFTNTYEGDIIDLSQFRIRRIKNRPVQKVNKDTGLVIEIFESMSDAANSISVDKGRLWHAIKVNGICKGFKWCYYGKHD